MNIFSTLKNIQNIFLPENLVIKSFKISSAETLLFKNGLHGELYKIFGAKLCIVDGKSGVHFSVWAPNAKHVNVIGDFNHWKKHTHRLFKNELEGIWEGFVEGAKHGDKYKFYIISGKGFKKDKIDPFASYNEEPPRNACIVWDSSYEWQDKNWMKNRGSAQLDCSPISVYELHLGSWRRSEDDNKFLNYREIAQKLVPYVKEMGFTHVELMPVMEHPYYVSWGYQTLGYFSPTSRYGTPEDLKYLIDQIHQHQLGVILDWVPSHFPSDDFGLMEYDGSHCYESGEMHPDWNSCIFNLGSLEVVDFLISSASFWFDEYHIDGLRVDAVASMLYLDYSRSKGEWKPNIFGGNQNLESIAFLRLLNQTIHKKYPEVLMIAEESTAWPLVTGSVDQGGLDFSMKWNMGWMHDCLEYFKADNKKREKIYDKLTFSFYYAYSDKYMLTLSHDEVVHEKSSLLSKMPGVDQEKFRHLRCLFGFMFAHPGKKCLFMGAEFAQWSEWNYDIQLEWDLLEYEPHQKIQLWVKILNKLYRSERALYEEDFQTQGFKWVDVAGEDRGIVCFLRKASSVNETIMVIGNFQDKHYSKFNVPNESGENWQVLVHSEDVKYGGELKDIEVVSQSNFGEKQNQLNINLMPNSIVFLKELK